MRINFLLLLLLVASCEKKQDRISKQLAPDKYAAFELSDSIFPPKNKGVALSYNRKNSSQKFFVFLGEHQGMEFGELGYRDYLGKTINVIGVGDNDIQAAVIDSGASEVGWSIADPEGMLIQGKDSGKTNYALKIKQGNNKWGNGGDLFSVRNDGQVLSNGNLGIAASNPLSQFEVGGSSGFKVKIISDTKAELDNATTYVFDGSKPSVWTLPELKNSANRIYFLKNRGNANVKIVCQNSEQLYSIKKVDFIEIKPGGSSIIQNDGYYWIVM